MKVLAVQASPRKGGNSDVLLEAVIEGVRAGGGDVDMVRLADLDIGPCVNCGGCEQDGRCVFDDGMTPLYDKIVAADRVVFASPIYFYGITAQGKLFVDRCQALWNRQRLASEKDAAWHADPGRKGFLVSVAATRGKRVFEGAVLTMKYAYDAMGLRYGGEFLVRGVDGMGDMAGETDDLARAVEFGRGCLE